jgi:hypothetical protein
MGRPARPCTVEAHGDASSATGPSNAASNCVRVSRAAWDGVVTPSEAPELRAGPVRAGTVALVSFPDADAGASVR